MILDLLTDLRADATLRTLLLGAATNTKIYDTRFSRGESTPYILVSLSADGTAQEVLSEQIVAMRIVAEEASEARAISDRLDVLYDIQDKLSVSSDDYYIYYGKKIGGSDLSDDERDHSEMLRLFLFKYVKKLEA